MPEDVIPANFLAFSADKMQSLHGDIATCLGKLTEEQIWQRGGPHENSVGNLLLHLEGNIRQWILHGIDNQLVRTAAGARGKIRELCGLTFGKLKFHS